MTDGTDIWYPTVDDILVIHEDIIREDPDGVPGVSDESRVQFALDYIRDTSVQSPPRSTRRRFT